MVDNVDDMFSLKKSSKISTNEFLKQQTEPIIRAQEIFKSSIEPHWNQIPQFGADIQTMAQKIEPLLKIQKNISDSVSLINGGIPGRIIFDPYKASLVSGAVLKLGQTLDTVQELTLKSGMLFKEANYNFIKNPVASALNFVTDNIALQQKSFITGLENIPKFNIESVQRLSGLASGSFGINSIALESIQESPFLFSKPVAFLPEIKDINAERISQLEEEVKTLKKGDTKIILSEVTKELEIILGDIDKSGSLLKKFKGACAVIGQNDDSLAQSAESMTRLMENFPFCLNKNHKLKTKTKNNIKEILANHLGVKYKNITDIKHPLIEQQYYFYDTFSQIRHGNENIYDSFEKDPAKYKALVLQAEGFLYQIIKYSS